MDLTPSRGIWWAAPAVSLALLIFTAFEWSLADRWSLFGMLITKCALWLVFLVVIMWSVVRLVRQRNDWPRSAIPFLVCALAIALVLVVPFTRFWIEWRYQTTQRDRNEVVAQVLDGRIQSPAATGIIALPPTTAPISTGGNAIVVEKHNPGTYILFYTYRGILDSYAGFLYVPPGGDPREFGDLDEVGSEIVHYDGQWYFVSHH